LRGARVSRTLERRIGRNGRTWFGFYKSLRADDHLEPEEEGDTVVRVLMSPLLCFRGNCGPGGEGGAGAR